MQININTKLTLKNIIEMDVCFINIPRDVVEKSDMSKMHEILAKFKKSKKQGRGKLALIFDGYNDVVDEIFEIPAIRDYCNRIVKSYPWIFYYLSDFQGLLGSFTACLADLNYIRGTNTKPISQFTLEEALNPPKYNLYIKLSSDLIKYITKGVIDYCFRIEEGTEVVAEVLTSIPGFKPIYMGGDVE